MRLGLMSAGGCAGGKCAPVGTGVLPTTYTGGMDGRRDVDLRHRRRHDDDSFSRMCKGGDCSDSYDGSSSCSKDFSCSRDFSESESRDRKRRPHRKECKPACGPLKCPDPIGRNKCTLLYEGLIRNIDVELIAALNAFEAQYRGQIVAFLNAVLAEVASFEPTFVGLNYVTLVTSINAVVGGTIIPASTATDLLNIQLSAIASITASIQETINRVLLDLLARIEHMCLPELIDLINSGLFSSQIVGAFTMAATGITPLVNVMLAAQLTLIRSLGLNAAQVTLATTALTTNSTALITFLNTAFASLTTQVGTMLSALITSLNNLLTSFVRSFQNLAISKINELVIAIFGTVGTPPPIPPVV